MKLKRVKLQKCKSLWSKAWGFMFSLSRKKSKLFIFDNEQNVGIHMLFVFMSLFVVWLDSRKRVVDFRLMIPFLSYYNNRAKYVIELPFNLKNARIFKKLKKGMKIEF